MIINNDKYSSHMVMEKSDRHWKQFYQYGILFWNMGEQSWPQIPSDPYRQRQKCWQ